MTLGIVGIEFALSLGKCTKIKYFGQGWQKLTLFFCCKKNYHKIIKNLLTNRDNCGIIKRTQRKEGVMANLTLKEIAKMTGLSYDRIRQIKRSLGRIPTIEEVLARKGKVGAPCKETQKNRALQFIGTKRNLKIFLENLIEKYGKNITLGEILEDLGRK
jgi:hypothetical protein